MQIKLKNKLILYLWGLKIIWYSLSDTKLNEIETIIFKLKKLTLGVYNFKFNKEYDKEYDSKKLNCK